MASNLHSRAKRRMTKILTVVGARPQFIKAAEVSLALEGTSLQEIIVHTGQHYDNDLSDVFFDELGIPHPKYNLEIGSGSHGAQTGRMLEKLEEVFLAERAEGVLVYGDTNSTMAGALAAAKLHIPLFHVEAGLRSYNKRMPEEINRVLTDHMSDLLFCPSRAAVDNLQKEGISGDTVIFSGDVMYDSILRHRDGTQDAELSLPLDAKGYVLVTIHRAENTDDPARLKKIVDSILRVSEEEKVVFPLHPRTKAALDRDGLLSRVEKSVTCLRPLAYKEMISAQQRSSLVITDSGGVQKEAYFLDRPCLVVRNETEWVELTEHGGTKLVSPESLADTALAAVSQPIQGIQGLYGDGRAAEKICCAIRRYFE